MKTGNFIGNDLLSWSSPEQRRFASEGPDGSPERKTLGVIQKRVFPKRTSLKKIYPIFKIPHVNLLLENIFEELFPLFYSASYKEVCYVFKYAS